VLALGLAGTGTELVLLEHYEDAWQWAPLLLIALAMAGLAWHWRRQDAASLRALRVVMVLFLVAGVAGLGLHFRGAAEFQLEIDPAMGTWDLVKKVMRAKAPPVLAPGVMLQMGLIGLAYTFSNYRDKRSEMP
jgi:NO-binding membrane sensor protein with MHYT domain